MFHGGEMVDVDVEEVGQGFEHVWLRITRSFSAAQLIYSGGGDGKPVLLKGCCYVGRGIGHSIRPGRRFEQEVQAFSEDVSVA